ncbi:DUF4349 domain-containing protein [Dyadobacter sandarakinus]|uniref:DUF4349 domain-containing protein n=1 Tax=Dyadobacter sandarakinus TaxID=2747268 RepID=A0ABX7I364_9BACT|nr:DUF4349 domain-containing protein [Dyadobacter sandarakinus]QRR00269.1 DUF4349 domain-containing protein [Dyadobacter sandarakinus]
MKHTLLVLVCMFCCFSCANEQGNNAVTEDVALMMQVPPPVDAQNNPAPAQNDKPKIARQLIKTGNVEFETDDIEKARKQILQAVTASQAYVGRDEQQSFPDKIQYTIAVRVPAAKFDDFLTAATRNVAHFDYKKIHVEDVTAQYLDFEARLKTKKDIEKRYLQLLASALKVGDILNIQKELGAIRTEIESTEGQLKYLGDQMQYSTLTIIFYEENVAPGGFFREVVPAFRKGWDIFLSFIIVLISLWPFLLTGAVIYLLSNAFIKKRKRRKALQSPAND